jgi:hypothetical protein
MVLSIYKYFHKNFFKDCCKDKTCGKIMILSCYYVLANNRHLVIEDY